MKNNNSKKKKKKRVKKMSAEIQKCFSFSPFWGEIHNFRKIPPKFDDSLQSTDFCVILKKIDNIFSDFFAESSSISGNVFDNFKRLANCHSTVAQKRTRAELWNYGLILLHISKNAEWIHFSIHFVLIHPRTRCLNLTFREQPLMILTKWWWMQFVPRSHFGSRCSLFGIITNLI